MNEETKIALSLTYVVDSSVTYVEIKIIADQNNEKSNGIFVLDMKRDKEEIKAQFGGDLDKETFYKIVTQVLKSCDYYTASSLKKETTNVQQS